MTSYSKYITFILLTVLLSNCSNNENKQAESKMADTATQQGTTDSAPVVDKDKLDNEPKLHGQPISFYLAHAQIPQVCKDLYNKKRPVRDDEDVMTLLDSMFTLNDETKAFYFLTITRTMEKADGAYAEPLGIKAKSFAETRTREFLNYFINEPMLTAKNYEEWVNTIVGEIGICAEGHEKAEAANMKKKMLKSCTECNEQQKAKLNDFVTHVSGKLQ